MLKTSDLVLKEIYGICETKNPSKEQVNEHKMTKQIYKKLANLSQEKLNTIDNKKTYVKNDVMTTIIKCCTGEKKRGIRAIDGFRNKLVIQILILKFLNVQNLKSNQK